MTDSSGDVQESQKSGASHELPLVRNTPYASVPDQAGRSEILAAVRRDRDIVFVGSDHQDFALVGDANGGKPDPARDSRWNSIKPNEAIEDAASAKQKWNHQDNPLPPIGQILAADTCNNPQMVRAVQEALKLQDAGDKTKIGDLIVNQIRQAGGDTEGARKHVEKAFSEQKAMQYDFGLQSLAGMAVPGGRASDGRFDSLAKGNPELADQIKKWTEADSRDKSPLTMANDLKKLQSDLTPVVKTVDGMLTDDERKSDPDSARKVQEKALSLMLEYPKDSDRALAINKLKQEVDRFHE